MFGFIIGLWADSFQKLQIDPADGRHAADLPRRRVLLDQHAAAVLAEGDAVQSGRLPDLRLPLGFYGISDVNVTISLAMTARLPAGVPDADLVDLQDRLEAQAMMR